MLLQIAKFYNLAGVQTWRVNIDLIEEENNVFKSLCTSS